jgi:homoserine kinase
MHWLAELDGRRLTVEIPATSANLGAGYDCLGLALDLYDRIELEVRGWSRGAIELTVDGEGAASFRRPRQPVRARPGGGPRRSPRRAARGRRLAHRDAEPDPDLPRPRSSAAATVGGLVAGNALAGEPLTNGDLLRLAYAIEGHPDNAAAALLGGSPSPPTSTASSRPSASTPHVTFVAVLFIPERRLSTKDMRKALPTKVPLADAVSNLGRVALGVAGIATGRTELLRELTVDRLHEPYRAAVYPELPRHRDRGPRCGRLGACLSVPGSTILAFADQVSTITRIEAAYRAASADLDLAGRILVVAPRNHRARVVP